jgi:hypothetical protein
MKFLGFCLSMVGLYIVYTGTVGNYNRPGPMEWAWVLYGIAFGAPFLAAGSWVSSKAGEATQAQRDQEARAVLERDNTEGESAFALYLRPFKVDGTFIADHSTGNLFDLDQYDRTGIDAMERIIGDALAKSYKTIAIGGGAHEVTGFGQVDRLENWQEKVSALIQRAAMVVALPLMTEYTMWEIGEIIERGALTRTIFVMPSAGMAQGEGLFQEWALAREEVARRFSLELPDYESSGGLFRFERGKGAPRFVKANTLGSPRAVAKAMNRVI